MQHLTNAITNLALIEATNAKQSHGTTYASHHEAFGVLAEEVQEAEYEQKRIHRHMGQLLWFLRTDHTEGIADCLAVLQHEAIRAAAESVQVAAVCAKWMEGLDHAEDES